MNDSLSFDEIDEILKSHLGTGWSGPETVLYLQPGDDDDQIEVVGNFQLTTVKAGLFRRSVKAQRLWEDLRPFIEAFEIDRAYVANQRIYRAALEQLAPRLTGGVRRFARRGDCQARSNFGTADEQEHGKLALKEHPSDDRAIVIMPVLGTELLFGLCSFTWEKAAFFTFKTCRPLDEFSELVIPTLAAEKEVRRIIVMDAELERQLFSKPSMRRYASLLVRVEPPADDVGADRAAIQALLRNVQPETPRLQSRKKDGGLFGGWLDQVRGLHRRDVVPDNLRGTVAPRAEALRTFYLVVEGDQAPDLRKAITDCKKAEPRLDGDFLLFAQCARVIAAAKLQQWDDLPPIDELLQRCGAEHPCLEALAEWGTRVRLQTGSPKGWFGLLAERAPDTLVKLAKQPEVYATIRTALQDEAPDAVELILPLATADENDRDGDAVRKLYRQLRSVDKDAAAFFKIVDDNQFIPDAVFADVLSLSRARWGESVDQVSWEAIVLHRLERYEEALRLADRWIALAKDPANAHYWRGQCLRLLKRWKEAVEAYRKATELDAEDNRAWREMGRCLWTLSRYEEAEVCARKAYEIDQRSSSLFVLGGVLYEQGKYAELIALLGEKDPDVLNDSSLARRLLLASIRLEEWPVTKQRILTIAPTLHDSVLADFLKEATDLLEEADQEERAVEMFPALLKDSEEFAVPAAHIVCCMATLKRVDDAMALCTRFAPFLPSSERLAIEYARLLYYGSNDRDAAYRVAEELLADHPESLFLLNTAGELAELGAKGSGADRFLRVVEGTTPIPDDPRDDSYYVTHRAIATYNLRDLAAARTAIIRVREIDPKSRYAPLLESMICFSAGDMNATVKACRDAQQLLAAQPAFKRESALDDHKIDLQCYSRRGLLPTAGWRDVVKQELGVDLGSD
jgi:tetratricopeptide (TPR) repeat protein